MRRKINEHRQTQHKQLHPDAPAVPPGMRPRHGVEYGCGDRLCRACYEPAIVRLSDIYPQLKPKRNA